MAKIDDEIAQAEAKLEQKRQQLRDLKAQATTKRKKEENRRIFIYGKAYLAGLEKLSPDQRQKSLDRVHANVESKSERKLLGLPPFVKHETSAKQAGDKSDDTPSLPFGDS